jgi:hypothetical protein
MTPSALSSFLSFRFRFRTTMRTSLHFPARRFARLATSVALAAASNGGCSVEYRACAVRCGDAGCPAGLSCADDGFCHDPGEPAACAASTSAGSAGRDGTGGPGGDGGGPPGGAGAPRGGATGNAPGGAAGAPSIEEVARACAAARVARGPATDPNGQPLDCGGCAGPSTCQATTCECAATEWARSDVDPTLVSRGKFVVTALGETHVVFPAPNDGVMLLGRRAPGGATFEALVPLASPCANGPVNLSRPSLATTPDGTVHAVLCAQGADSKRAFRSFARPPGGAPVETPAPAGPVGLGPFLLAGTDGTLHLLYFDVDARTTRYARRTPGGARTEPEVVHADGRLLAAAIDGANLIAVYASGATVSLARLALGAARPWRQTTLPVSQPARGSLGSSAAAAASLLPDGRAVVAYNYDVKGCEFDRNCAVVDSYVVDADGTATGFKNHVSSPTTASVADSIKLAAAADPAGRAHLIAVTPSSAGGTALLDVRAEVYDGTWRPATTIGTTTAAEFDDSDSTLEVTASESALHVLAGTHLFEGCL